MTTELQPLLERIHKEAVEKAERQADDLLRAAKEKAQKLLEEAEEEARRRLEKADKDAQAFTERSTRTLEQSARDLLIAVGQGVDNILGQLVHGEVGKALSPEVVRQMLVAMAERYAERGGENAGLEVLVSAEQREELAAFFRHTYRERLAEGVEVRADREVFQGFQVAFRGGKVYHDFSREAIAAALTGFLRPQLADIIKGVAGRPPSK